MEVLEVFHVAMPQTKVSAHLTKARQKRFRTIGVLFLLLNELGRSHSWWHVGDALGGSLICSNAFVVSKTTLNNSSWQDPGKGLLSRGFTITVNWVKSKNVADMVATTGEEEFLLSGRTELCGFYHKLVRKNAAKYSWSFLVCPKPGGVAQVYRGST